MPRERLSARTRFTWGIILLIFGAFALTVNLGVRIPRNLWDYWPVLLLVIGGMQMIWPGTARDRLSGYWLLAAGFYGLISVFELFGLHWGTSWPILVVALGIRVVLSGLFRSLRDGAQESKTP